MGRYVRMFLALLREHPYLLNRHTELAQYVLLARSGRMSETMAKGLVFQLEMMIDHDRDHPCYLHRPPLEAQLASDGPADIEFFTLVESEEGLRYGLRLLDRPRHLLIAGTTGSGKTTALRSIIFKIHEMNQRSTQK